MVKKSSFFFIEVILAVRTNTNPWESAEFKELWPPCAQKQCTRPKSPEGNGANNSLQVCGMSSGDGCQKHLIAFWRLQEQQKGRSVLENHLKS